LQGITLPVLLMHRPFFKRMASLLFDFPSLLFDFTASGPVAFSIR